MVSSQRKQIHLLLALIYFGWMSSINLDSVACIITHYKFVGAGTPIADEAVTIWEAVKEQVDASQSEMKAMEEAVKEQLSGKPKKKKKRKKSAGKKSGDGVVVGGVDLGDIDFNFADIGSDSDEDGLMNL